MAKLIGSLIAAMEDEADGHPHTLFFTEGAESGSLNAHVDAEDIFETPLVPGEVPELRDDVNLIATLESRLEDLNFLIDDLQKAGGMTQHFALEAQKLLPDFGQVPVGYYSVEPSATRYKVALEEMSRGIVAMIAAAIAAVITVIYKIYAWLAGKEAPQATGSSGKVTPTATAQDATQAVKQMQEETKKMSIAMDVGQEAIKEADQLLANANLILKNEHGKEYHVKSFQDIIKNIFTDHERYNRAKQFLETPDGMMLDIIHNGPYSKLMINVAERMTIVNTAMVMKFNLLDQVIRKDLGSSDTSSALKNTDALNKASKPVELSVDGRVLNLTDTADHLKTKRTEARQTPPQQMTFDTLFTTMAKTYSSHTIDRLLHQQEQLLHCLASLNGQLEKMQSVARDLSTDGTPGAMTQDIGTHLRNALFQASREVVAMGMISAEIKMYFKNLQHLANQALGFGVEVVRKAASEMRKHNQDVPEGWQAVLDDLMRQQKAITAGYYRRK